MTNAVGRVATADMAAAEEVTVATAATMISKVATVVEGKMNNAVDDKNSTVAEGHRKVALEVMIEGKSMANNVMVALVEEDTEMIDAKRVAGIKEAMVVMIDVKSLLDMAVAHLGDKTATTIAHQAKVAAMAVEARTRTKAKVISLHRTVEEAPVDMADRTIFPMRPSTPRRTLADLATQICSAWLSVCFLETRRS